MDIQITVKLRVTATNMSPVADAVHSAMERLVDSVNFGKDKKQNAILTFEATEIRPNSTIKREFVFPDDLDQVKKS